MNREQIIEMARDSGMELYGLGKDREKFLYHLERFFNMAQAAERSNWPAEMEAMERQVNILTDELAKAVAVEREACAKVCEEPGWNAANWCAKAIRARGQQ
jgi:hypothetical protein